MTRAPLPEEPRITISFVLDNTEICEHPHPMVRCYVCKHRFLSGEEYVLITTSGGTGRYRAHNSKFCLTCVMKTLIADINYLENMMQRRDRARLEALKENQAKSERTRL